MRRFFSILLTLTIILSSFSLSFNTVTAEETIEYTYISDYSQFLDFLSNSNNTSSKTKYYKLINDIVADSTASPIGGYVANKIELDGDGHTISGLNINGALFAEIDKAQIMNIVFKNATVNGTQNTAVLADRAEEEAVISDCRFENCKINIPSSQTEEVYSGFVAATSIASIINCLIDESCAFAGVNADVTCYSGGVAGYNEGYVAGCYSRVNFDSTGKGANAVQGGITGCNELGVYSCVSATDNLNAIGENTGRYTEVDTVVQLENGKYTLVDEDSSSMSVEYISALLSESAQVFNNEIVVEEGYPFAKLWTVESNAIVYANDARNAYVFLNISKELSGAVINPSWDSADITVGKDGLKIPVCAGKANGSDFIRNSFEITYKTSPKKMVNNFVLKGVHDYVYSLDNIMDNNANGNYSTMFFAATKVLNETETVNKATVTLYPFDMELSLSNTGVLDELVDYRFDGEGTEKNPYKISGEEELRLLAEYVNSGKSHTTSDGKLRYNEAHYVLTTDINLSSREWIPIGAFKNSTDPQTAFRGVFDGQAHTIKGLTMTSPQSYKGLFGFVYGMKDGDKYKNAVIRNINVLDVSIREVNPSGGTLINRGDIKGAVIGNAVYTTISGCVGSGYIEGKSQLAGVVGYAMKCDINNCGSFADIHTYFDNAWSGGITGYAEYSSVKNCYSASTYTNHTVTDDIFIYTGGIAGYVKEADFEQDFFTNSSSITIPKYKGTEIKDSSYLKSDSYVQVLNDYAEDNLQNLYWSVKGGYSYPLVVSSNERQYKVNCLYTSNGNFTVDNAHHYAGDKVILNPPTNTSEHPDVIIRDLKDNVLDIDVYDEGNGKLSFTMPKQSVQVEPCFKDDYLVGLGTSSDPYLIRNFDELCILSDFINDANVSPSFYAKHYLVTADINAQGNNFNPIGVIYPFKGVFDGGYHTISNLNITDNDISTQYTAFFANVQGAEIKNISFENIKVEGEYAAVLIGVSDEADIKNISIADSQVKADIHSAGVVLFNENDIRIKNCLFIDITLYGARTGALSYENIAKYKTYYVENTVIANISGTENLVCSGHSPFYQYKLSDVYFCGFEVSEISDYLLYPFNMKPKIISSLQLNSGDFIADRGEYASKYGYCAWGKDKNGRIALKLSDDVKGIYRIKYDSVFSNASFATIDLNDVPTICNENELITLDYDKQFYVKDVRITGVDGRNVEYFLKSVNDKTGAIQFVMPDCNVTVTNNGQTVQQIQPLSGKGTSSLPYLVKSADDLMTIANVIAGTVTYRFDSTENEYSKACFKLTADIDMNGVMWNGIGMNGTEFNGTFNGDYHTISNLNQNTGIADGSRNGLFAIIGSSGKVENLTVKSATIFSESTPVKGSGAIAKLNKGVISKCMVFDSSIQLGNWVNLGGIAGQNDGTIECCGVVNTSFTRRWGGVSTHTIGGITQANNGTVSRCYTYNCGFTNGTSQNGAIIAYGNAPEYCYYYTTATVNGTYGTSSSSYDFSCGRIAYYMNLGASDNVWRQNITYGPLDSYPYPYPSHRIVYRDQYSLHESFTNVKPSYYPGKVYGTHTVKLGDINVDGEINELDKQMLIDFLSKNEKLDKISLIACDVNCDGKITKEDLELIEEHLKSCEINDCDVLGKEIDVTDNIPVQVEKTDDGKYIYTGDDFKNPQTDVDFIKTGDNTLTANIVNILWLLIILVGLNMVLLRRRTIVYKR